MPKKKLPTAFVLRRTHSLMGLGLVVFLIEHIITNSQAALLFGHDGSGFVRSVNFIKNLPYLPFIEIFLLGMPIAFHAVWGIYYMLSGKMNAKGGDGTKPSLPEHTRNHAYSWQRITSWILLIGIIAHVGFMRFYNYPIHAPHHYIVRISMDKGLYSVADRLDVELLSNLQINAKTQAFESETEPTLPNTEKGYSEYADEEIEKREQYLEQKAYVEALHEKPITSNQVLASCPDFGTATLLVVRDAFKNPWTGLLYSIFVGAAAFHAFNGLWTFCITWGLILNMRSQKRMVNVCTGFMVIIAVLGLASIWGTYWINLRN